MRREFYLSGVFGAGASLALTALGLLVLPGLLQLLQTPPGVAGYAADYLRIIFLGFPAAFAYHLASGGCGLWAIPGRPSSSWPCPWG